MKIEQLLTKALSLLVALLLAVPTVSSQTKTARVTGKVTDENGVPMAGVTIVVEGSPTIGTTTGTAGEYTLNSPPPRGADFLIFRL